MAKKKLWNKNVRVPLLTTSVDRNVRLSIMTHVNNRIVIDIDFLFFLSLDNNTIYEVYWKYLKFDCHFVYFLCLVLLAIF